MMKKRLITYSKKTPSIPKHMPYNGCLLQWLSIKQSRIEKNQNHALNQQHIQIVSVVQPVEAILPKSQHF